MNNPDLRLTMTIVGRAFTSDPAVYHTRSLARKRTRLPSSHVFTSSAFFCFTIYLNISH